MILPMGERSESVAQHKIFAALSSTIRLEILKALSSSDMSYTDLFNKIGMRKERDVGKFTYHLKQLLNLGLVEVNKETKRYTLSENGRLVLELVEKIEEALTGKKRRIVTKSDLNLEEFSKFRIVEDLVKEAKLPPKVANRIASSLVDRIKVMNISNVPATMIRYLVCSELLDAGFEKAFWRTVPLTMPVNDFNGMIREALHKRDVTKLMRSLTLELSRRYLLHHSLGSSLIEKIYLGLVSFYDLDCLLLSALGLNVMPSEKGTNLAEMFIVNLFRDRYVILKDALLIHNSCITPKLLTYITDVASSNSFKIVVNDDVTSCLSERKAKSRLQEVFPPSFLSELQRVNAKISYPLSGDGAYCFSSVQNNRILYNGEWSGNLIHIGDVSVALCTISINLYGLLASSEWDFDVVNEQFKTIAKDLDSVIDRRMRFMRRLIGDDVRANSVILIAPIGAYEAAHYISKAYGRSLNGALLLVLGLVSRFRSYLRRTGDLFLQTLYSWPKSVSNDMYARYLNANTGELKSSETHLKALKNQGSFVEHVLPFNRVEGDDHLRRLLEIADAGCVIDCSLADLERYLHVLDKRMNVILRISYVTSS